jgi:hypothetical protein
MKAKSVKCQLCGKAVLRSEVAFARVVVDGVATTRRRVCPTCAKGPLGSGTVVTLVGNHRLVWSLGGLLAVAKR